MMLSCFQKKLETVGPTVHADGKKSLEIGNFVPKRRAPLALFWVTLLMESKSIIIIGEVIAL